MDLPLTNPHRSPADSKTYLVGPSPRGIVVEIQDFAGMRSAKPPQDQKTHVFAKRYLDSNRLRGAHVSRICPPKRAAARSAATGRWRPS